MTASSGKAGWIGGACAAALLLSGCGSVGGSDTLGNLLAFNSLKAPPVQQKPNSVAPVDCPVVSVDDDSGTVRVYAGADHSSQGVRYQLDIAQYARECDPRTGEVAIKVGVEGRLVLGPSGAAGPVDVPVKISIKRQSDNSIVASTVLRESVVPQGGEATFDVVSDPLIAPLVSDHPDADYMIVVGFDQGGAPIPSAKRVRAKAKKG